MAGNGTDCFPLPDLVAKLAGLVVPIAIGTFIDRQLYVNKYLDLLLRVSMQVYLNKNAHLPAFPLLFSHRQANTELVRILHHGDR